MAAAAPLSVQLPRLKELCAEWARLNATPSEAADLDNLATETGVAFNAIALASAGDKLAANQRAVPVAQFLLKAATAPVDVAMVLSRPSPTAAVNEYVLTVLSVAPITTAPLAEGQNAADYPQVKLVRAAGAALTEADTAALVASVAATAGPSAIAVMANEFQLHSTDSPFVTAVEAAVRSVEATSAGAIKVAKAPKLFTALLIPKYDTDTAMAIRRASAMYTAVFKAYVTPTLDTIAAGASANVSVAQIRTNAQNYLNAANTLPGYDKLSDWRSFGAVLQPQMFVEGKYADALFDEDAGTDIVTPKACAGSAIIRLSARNREQCVLGSRTYFFKDTAAPNAGDALTFAAAVQSAVWFALNAAAAAPGTKTVATVAAEALKTIETLPNAAAFLPYLSKDFGGIIGPVMTDKRSFLVPNAETSTLLVRPNTSFYVKAILKGVPSAAADGTTFTVELGDSIIAGMAEDFAKRAPRTYPEVLMLNDSDPARPAAADTAGADASGIRKAVTRGQVSGGVNAGISAEEARITKQAKLWEEKEREFGSAGPKPKSEDATAELSTIGRIAAGNLQSYASRAAISNAGLNLSAEKLFANAPALTVWLPVGGKSVPFHMSTIKEVNVRADGSSGYLCTIVFHSTQESYLAFRSNRSKIFVRELSYRATDSAMFDAVRNAVIIGHETIKDADKKRQAEKGLLPSTGLGIRSGAVIAKLPNVMIRPQVYAKISNRGTFEATEKGFRFDFSGGGLTPIEIAYDNVHFCICQPANNDIQVLFHVVLYKPIQWGKEKAGVKEFQVAAMVLEASEGVNGRRKMSEQEELQQEENERLRVNATNKEFIEFSRRLSTDGCVKNLFVPNKSFDIDGSMGKGNVRIRGSTKALWQINETPFQSVIFSEIEIAMLERMIVGGKSFDLVLVPKNYRNKVVMISSIPMKKAEEVKTWLCGGDIVYIEIGTNQNYPRLFKQFEADPEWNPWDSQGWRAMIEDEDEDEEDSDSSDDSWGGSSDEDGSDDDSDSDYSGSEDESEGDASSSGASGGGDDSDDTGDWSDMERRAEEEDDDNDGDESSDDDRPKKKIRTGNAPPARGGMMGRPMAGRR